MLLQGFHGFYGQSTKILNDLGAFEIASGHHRMPWRFCSRCQFPMLHSGYGAYDDDDDDDDGNDDGNGTFKKYRRLALADIINLPCLITMA